MDVLSDSESLIDEDDDADPDLDFVQSINEIPNETSEEDVSSEDDAPEPSTSSRGRSRVRASKRVRTDNDIPVAQPSSVDSDEDICGSNTDTGATRRPRARGRGRPRALGRGRATPGRGLAIPDGVRANHDGPRSRDGIEGLEWQQIVNNRNFHPFSERVGPQARIDRTSNELHYFNELFTSQVWKLLVDMTNLNAQTKRQADPQHHKGRW